MLKTIIENEHQNIIDTFKHYNFNKIILKVAKKIVYDNE